MTALATQAIMQTLVENAYQPRLLRGKQIVDVLSEVSLFEQIAGSELCVFLLDTHVSGVHVALGMAHAHSIPSIRIRYDPKSTSCEPAVGSGLITWSNVADLVTEFKRQIQGFRRGFVEAVDLRAIAKTQWTADRTQLWDPSVPETIIKHLYPSDDFVQDEIGRVRNMMGGSLLPTGSRRNAYEICTRLYNEFKRFHFAYELEPPTVAEGKQAIRSAVEIRLHNAATCIDLACMFGSLLRAANHDPVIILFARAKSAHVLVGYKAPASFLWDEQPEINDLRAAVNIKDIVVFEPTGAVESDSPGGAETEEERRAGGKMLDFETAVLAARRFIESDAELRYFFTVG
jgi:hypothetical protein